MKLTALGASDEARQLIPVFCGHHPMKWGANGMKGRALHGAGLAAVGCALLAGASEPPRATDVGRCPSFAALGRRVDANVHDILSLKPGLPLKEFTSSYASPALNFWDDVGSDKETVFFVAVTDGNAQVSDQLVCRFDRGERLRSCRKECCRNAGRTITQEQYSSLVVGDARPEVERRLCSPSDVEVDRKKATRVSTYYDIDLPVGHHDEGQTVVLVFEEGKLMSKDMSPYY